MPRPEAAAGRRDVSGRAEAVSAKVRRLLLNDARVTRNGIGVYAEPLPIPGLR